MYFNFTQIILDFSFLIDFLIITKVIITLVIIILVIIKLKQQEML